MPPVTVQQAFTLALQHRQAGRLAEAEALCRQILAVEPNEAEVLHLLGLIALQTGRHDLAVDLIRQSTVLRPDNGAAHFNLGEVFRARGRFLEALAAYRRALQLDPDVPEIHNNLGIVLTQQGQFDEAIASYRRALELKPDYAKAWNNLGIAFSQRGQADEAIAHYRRALQIQPTDPEAHNNLGNALSERGRFDEAIASFRRVLQIQPDDALAHYNLGNALRERGQLAEAITHYRRALQIQPAWPEVHNNLGLALAGQGQLEEALAAYRRALQLQPDWPEAHNNLGNALQDRGQLAEAIAHYQRALELKPRFVEAHHNLATALQDCRRLDDAVAVFRRVLELKPDFAEAHNNLGATLAARGQLDEAVAAYRRAMQLQPEYAPAQSNLLYALHFLPGWDPQMIAEEHGRWNRQFAEPLRKFHQPQANDRDPERRLRIGYVSPDFNRHPISYFVTPLLEAHDKARIEIYCYASVRRPDRLTERVKKTADVWRDVFGLGDHDLAERIRADQIDILVDLTQHMANNRMLMFARKPAPVQVSWLGYPAGLGVPAMDYRFTDSFLEPEGSPWSASVETPIRLPDSWFCYDPIEYLEVAALPAPRTGQITFGSVNNIGKVNEAVLRLWLAVLQAVEGSRLLLHCPAGAAQTRLRQWFEAQGLAPHRLELVPRTATRAEFLEIYQRIDIGLDPFPYNGGTTTCDTLWMGVPVVSLAGRRAVSRLGLSVLANAGLPWLVASSEEDYVRIAAQLAHDFLRLTELRATLRTRIRASPLMDAPRFARNIEAAYRSMWQGWCARES